ncbi:MAG: hypothetical protein AAF799_43080 [Myxococcota bacterium]
MQRLSPHGMAWLGLASVLCMTASTGCREPVCGQRIPVRIVEDPGGRVSDLRVDRFGDQVLAEFSAYDGERSRRSAVVTDVCGGPPVQLFAPVEAESQARLVDGHVLVLDQPSRRIEFVADAGLGERHEVFTDVTGCIAPVAGGLAAERVDGTVWFHPDPSDPDAQPLRIFAEAMPDADETLADLEPCQSSGVVADGNGVIVLAADGSVVHVSVHDRSRHTLIEGPVDSFDVLSNPRFIAWLRSEDGDRLIRDRQTGDDRRLGRQIDPSQGDGHFFHFPNDRWVCFVARAHTEYDTDTRCVDLQTNELASYRFATHPFYGSLNANVLLFGGGAGPIRWNRVTDDDVTRLNFDPLPHTFGRAHDGLLGRSRDPATDERMLTLMPTDGGPIRVLSREPATTFRRTRNDTIISVVRNDEPGSDGTLMLQTPSGERRPLAEHVEPYLSVPGYQTPDEIDELLYAVTEGDDAGIWRYVLP